MSATRSFQDDAQFLRLVRREADIDLVVVTLEIARDEQPGLDFAATLETIRSSVASLTRSVAMAGNDINELNLLINHLTDDLNLRGDDRCFDEPQTSYLNCVLESGRGLPITLSVIYMAIASELGIPLEGIAAPSHFLTRLNSDAGIVYVDPFRQGLMMDEVECVEWLHEITELPTAEIYPTLKPVSERAIIIRMLNNLKTLFGSKDQWTAAWKVQRRLALLKPGSWRERRDLAILTLRAGRPGEASRLLEHCISVCTIQERPVLQHHLRRAKQLIPQFN
jgi:regulator of sirC expression with transglutaminase-like and TPR domain